MPEIKTEKRSLRYDFKARETHEMSMQLAQKTIEGAEIENESKAVQSQYTSRLKVVKSEDVRKKMSIGKFGKAMSYTKPVINIQTGVFYNSLADAARSTTHIKEQYLARMLRGERKNKTSFVYA